MSFGASAITASSASLPSTSSADSMSATTTGPIFSMTCSVSAPSATSFSLASTSRSANQVARDIPFSVVMPRNCGGLSVDGRKRMYFDGRGFDGHTCRVAVHLARLRQGRLWLRRHRHGDVDEDRADE